MSDKEVTETREFWDRVAADWEIQVGSEGDRNRRLNSDPVLWDFAGEVADLAVLDADAWEPAAAAIMPAVLAS